MNIYYDEDGKTEIIRFDITDTKNPIAFSSHVMMGDDESLNVHWSANGELNYASVIGSYSEDFDCYITFDDEGDVIQYNLFNETSDIYFNADGSVKRAEMYGDDADVYSYVDGKWYLNGEEEIVQVPEWAVSIAEDLGGADTAILFIRNVATYRQPYTNAGGELSRYWRNRDRWIESREDMMTLLGIEAK